MQNLKSSLLVTCFIVAAFLACKKMDVGQKNHLELPAHSFFMVPQTTKNEVKAIAQNLKQDNDKHNFVNKVIRNAGFPKWDKAKIVKYDNGILQSKESTSDFIGEIIYIPFVK